jgi:hypothetical protein
MTGYFAPLRDEAGMAADRKNHNEDYEISGQTCYPEQKIFLTGEPELTDEAYLMKFFDELDKQLLD